MRFIKLTKAMDGHPLYIKMDEIVVVTPNGKGAGCFIYLHGDEESIHVAESAISVLKNIDAILMLPE